MRIRWPLLRKHLIWTLVLLGVMAALPRDWKFELRYGLRSASTAVFAWLSAAEIHTIGSKADVRQYAFDAAVRGYHRELGILTLTVLVLAFALKRPAHFWLGVLLLVPFLILAQAMPGLLATWYASHFQRVPPPVLWAVGDHVTYALLVLVLVLLLRTGWRERLAQFKAWCRRKEPAPISSADRFE